jgi:TMEM175 potassium channel family protein
MNLYGTGDAGVRYSREESEFDRAIGFFDATFALALTLLVTTLDVSGDRSVWESLGSLDDEVGSQFIAFAIAFALIANYWLVHHRLIASFDALDTPVIVANLFLIAAVVLLPFSTEAVGDPEIDDLALPTAVFALDVAAASMMLTIIYWLAWKRDLFRSRPRRPELRANLIASAVPAVVFIASIPIAYVASPTAAKLSWLSLLILNRIGGARRRSKAEPPDA